MANELSSPQKDIDILNRENFIQTLYELITSYQKNNQVGGFAVYGNWGVGKTFILNKLEERLPSDTYMVLSYSAWEYDYYDEPLIALLAAIKDTLSQNGQYDAYTKVFKEKLPSILYSLTKITTLAIAGVNPVVASVIGKLLNVSEKFVESCNKESKNLAFDEQSTFKSALTQFQNVLKELSKDRKIIFLIDELDRCLPQYQIKVLEHIHHLSKGIDCICVYAISDEQLRHTVSNIFGQNVDFNGYMKKFIDFHLVLDNAQVDDNILTRYKEELENFKPDTSPENNEIIYDLIKTMLSGLTIRTQEKIWDKQKILHSIVFQKNKKEPLLVLGCEIMFLAMLQRYNRFSIDRKDVKDRLEQKITYLDFLSHYFPERDSSPMKPMLDSNIINLYKRYTEEVYNHLCQHNDAQYKNEDLLIPLHSTINFDKKNVNLKILYIWDTVTGVNTKLWKKTPPYVNVLRDNMKVFYAKAILLQDKS